ncbi:MAG: hypothetical protein LBC18_10905, partial [Opitutaceae bacterium]|nr:hypothetical protein [Opitutaceae bacterium]
MKTPASRPLVRALLAGLFLIAPLAALHAQNASTVRAATAALIGRNVLTEDEQQLLERLKTGALKDPEVTAALLAYETARNAWQENQRKFPSERSPEVGRAYRAASSAATVALRQAMLAADPAAAALFRKLDLQVKRRKNEGENNTDSDTGNKAAVAPVKDTPGLPRVLLIGDSISIGYTLQVRALLAGRANLHRIPVNGGATEVGLAKIDDWLGKGKWD